MRTTLSTLWASVLFTLVLHPCTALAQTANGALKPAEQRKAAPELGLEDTVGTQANLRDYRGKVVVVDFWATWCHGCLQEMPWFAEFQRKYGDKGLNVIGVSLDVEGWKVVKPFVEKAAVPYRIVLGNDASAQAYAIGNMPDTFLIDQEGRIAATYVGMVDKNGLEKNIQKLLAQK
jgi:cytochrome c biogenesis protein CcmG/thiol:disulfide interchange protein DsbE